MISKRIYALAVASAALTISFALGYRPSLGLPLIAGILFIGLAVWLRDRPSMAFWIWLIGVCFIPVWAEFSTPVGQLAPAVLLSALVLPAATHRTTGRLLLPDVVVISVVVLGAFSAILLETPRYATAALILQYVPAFVTGRGLISRCEHQAVVQAIASVGAFAAAWSVAEYLFEWHAFQQFPGYWTSIQTRGESVRSEATFGHALALGGFLALTIPIVGLSSFRFRFCYILICSAGVLATLSRGPLIAAGLGLLAICLQRDQCTARWQRLTLGLVLACAAIFLLPQYSNTSSVNRELDGSNEYRLRTFSTILIDSKLIGAADNVYALPGSGGAQFVYRFSDSVDSTFLLSILNFGLIFGGVLIAVFIVLAVRVLCNKASPYEIALVCQIPVLATVALITQYGPIVWLVAGLAVGFNLKKGLNQSVDTSAVRLTSRAHRRTGSLAAKETLR